MGRVCSMESKAALPILVRRAGREWQRLNFAALGKGKTRGTFGKKAPGLHTSLRNPPGASPVLSSDQKKTGKLQHQRQHRNSTGLSGPITPQKKSHNSLNQKLLSARPTNLATHVVQKIHYLIFDMHYAYYKANTHTYIKSTHRALLGQYM